MREKTVDAYILSLDPWQAEIARKLRAIVKAAAPEASESIKWAQPVYELNGPFAYFKAFKNTVNFGFWRGADLEDPQGLLEGSGEKMRHVKLGKVEEVDRELLTGFVRQAVELNLQKGDPTKSG
ncbi:MAG: DUF1801 domain-containing protein [Anaerolineales bacterium]|jgi:hypothetical protein